METISKLSFWLLTAVLYLSVIVNGFTDAIRSVTYPDIKEQMDFPYTQYGMLQSLGQFSYLLWAFAATFSMPYIGFKATFSISGDNDYWKHYHNLCTQLCLDDGRSVTGYLCNWSTG